MNEAKSTPGPWSAVKYGTQGRLRIMAGSMPIATVTSGSNTDFAHNAHLIAAAPDLLEALAECGEWFGLTKEPFDQWEDLAEQFHKETGFLRPGKSYPMAAGLSEEREAERSAAWKSWSEKRRDGMIARVRAAIASATK